MNADKRQGYIDGLRKLADKLEAHPNAPVPFYGSSGFAQALVMCWTKEEFMAAAKAFGGKKVQTDSGVAFENTLGEFHLKVMAVGNSVCERVQVGTKTEIEYNVPDEVRAQYAVQVEVPQYETRCPESVLRLGGEEVS